MSNQFSLTPLILKNTSAPPTTTTTRDIRRLVHRNARERSLTTDRRLTYLALLLVSFSVTLLLLTTVAGTVLAYTPNVIQAVTQR
jgi:hypothetical protein